ncbi:hypothetical protein BP5796_07149 [Coleophoma crateriformis]|uniref:Uncharacterized protein n=1 Tax=Coleophoma crateriformis TaxID=565419 RepID=A0A3D8RI36_9HELO|nr:hypothetical protein BP5796_07149 [Coleophoma crateriformis]
MGGPLITAFKTALVGAPLGAGAFAVWTRNCKFVPVSPSDPIFQSASYLKNNPLKNPATQDMCVRRVPLKDIKPQLLEKEGKLAEAFCAGVWGGLGYWYQRRYLAKKYQNTTTTAHQLWERSQLQNSTYEVGTQITDHFEVVSKTPNAITVRCGDSPLKTGLRDSDGLFEMAVDVKPEEGVAEFKLKSVFYKGLTKSDSKPMPEHIEWAHRQYTKLWMESAIRNVEM